MLVFTHSNHPSCCPGLAQYVTIQILMSAQHVGNSSGGSTECNNGLNVQVPTVSGRMCIALFPLLIQL